MLAGGERSFCCAGCLAIASAIHGAGLEAFYAQRSSEGNPPVPAADDEWAQWDVPAVQAGRVRTSADGAAEVALLIDGIECGACVWLIEQWLAREPGVLRVAVNLATRRASLAWDPAQTRLSAILRALARVGYRGHPYDPGRREAMARREARALLLRTAVALLAMMQVMMFAVPAYISADEVEPVHRRLLEWASLTLTLPVLLYSALPFWRGAWRGIRMSRPGMDVPVALGLAGAFVASAHATWSGTGAVYYDSITMFVALLLVARYVELAVRRRAGDAVEAMARSKPATALRLPRWPETDPMETVAAAMLVRGQFVLVRPGAIVPCDGIVIDGRAQIEEALLTGEARPRPKAVGDRVLAGSAALDGSLIVRVEAAGEATRLGSIERLCERATGERPRVSRLADRVARHFVVALLAIALVTGITWLVLEPERALAITFSVLAVSCPCALSLATPAAMAAAAGALSRRNVVITRADAMEALARVTHVVLDKTGTLTGGRIRSTSVALGDGVDAAAARGLAVALESRSEHPLASAFRSGGDAGPAPTVERIRHVPGEGIEGWLDGATVRIGRPGFVAAIAGEVPESMRAALPADATLVALGQAGRGVLALFALEDPLRPGARDLVRHLDGLGIETRLYSGDAAPVVAATRAKLGIREAEGDLRPEDKRARVAALQARAAVVAMVGDGINDAPSLAQAQVSISLGSATPLAQWTADVVILSDDVSRIGETIEHARRTLRIVRQNLVWAFAYNIVAIPAAASGLVTPLVAALGMSLSSIVVVVNAVRAARVDSPLARVAGIGSTAASSRPA